MLSVAFAVLAVAVLLGTTLAVQYLRGGTEHPAPRMLAALHGGIGVGGLCCLVLALRGPPRGLDQGTASFGAVAGVLLAAAAVAGLGVLLMRRGNGQRVGTVIGLHATLAVSGFVVLVAYLFA